jgi:chromosome segregation ATPase
MKKIIIYLIPIFTVALFSCKSEKSELEALKQRLQNDSLLLADMGNEMEEIDKTISEITAFTTSSDKSTPEKIKEMESLIISSNAKITELEKKIVQSNSSFKNTTALTKSLDAQRKLIDEQRVEIERLSGKVIELEGEIVKKDSEIGGLKTVAGENAKTIAQAEARLRQLNSEINSAQMSKNNLDRQINQEYFAMAKTLIELAEDRKGLLPNAEKQRGEMTIKAYEYLCKLHKRGDYSALTEMSKLENNSKLKKYLKGQSCR